jgi:hypothetical protein
VLRFPARVGPGARPPARKENFSAVLSREASLHAELRRNVPALFAA